MARFHLWKQISDIFFRLSLASQPTKTTTMHTYISLSLYIWNHVSLSLFKPSDNPSKPRNPRTKSLQTSRNCKPTRVLIFGFGFVRSRTKFRIFPIIMPPSYYSLVPFWWVRTRKFQHVLGKSTNPEMHRIQTRSGYWDGYNMHQPEYVKLETEQVSQEYRVGLLRMRCIQVIKRGGPQTITNIAQHDDFKVSGW